MIYNWNYEQKSIALHLQEFFQLIFHVTSQVFPNYLNIFILIHHMLAHHLLAFLFSLDPKPNFYSYFKYYICCYCSTGFRLMNWYFYFELILVISLLLRFYLSMVSDKIISIIFNLIIQLLLNQNILYDASLEIL